MEVKFFQPSASWSHLIEHYIFLKHVDQTFSVKDKFIPSGNSALVINFKTPVVCFRKLDKFELPNFFISTPLSESLDIEVYSPAETMTIVFKTSVFSKMFKISMDEPQSTPYRTTDVFNGFPLRDYLNAVSCNLERISLFENYLQANYDNYNYEPDEIDLMYNEIMQSNGTIEVGDLTKRFNINDRSFRRKFQKRIGICAKELIRLVRVNHLWTQLKFAKPSEYHHIIYSCKFYDQSHFIKDFKSIIGETPRSFFNRNLENVEIISGKIHKQN